jgi:hypothetical protein
MESGEEWLVCRTSTGGNLIVVYYASTKEKAMEYIAKHNFGTYHVIQALRMNF